MVYYYLDYNATTPVDPKVQETICSTLKNSWGDPNCSYDHGKDARSVIEEARRKVAEMIGSAPNEIIFTSGGTESNYMVIETAIRNFYTTFGRCSCRGAMIPHVITSNIEHESIRLPLQNLVEKGRIEATFVPVSARLSGTAVAEKMASFARYNTCLITLILANHETGVVQPVNELRSALRNHFDKLGRPQLYSRVLIHTDASQALGKMDVDVEDLDVDYLTISGHKFCGPRIGAIYALHGRPLYSLFFGDERQENTCMIAGLGKAAELVTVNLTKYRTHMAKMRDYLETLLSGVFGDDGVVFNARHCENRLPNTASVAFIEFNDLGKELLAQAKKVCAGFVEWGEASPVLVNSGVDVKLAERTLRFSVGRETQEEDIDSAVTVLYWTCHPERHFSMYFYG